MRERSEGHHLTASRPDESVPTTATGRISFARIREPLEVPDLLALQRNSFDWLIGSDAWKARVAEALEEGRDDVNPTSGLDEVFDEMGEIQDFQKKSRL